MFSYDDFGGRLYNIVNNKEKEFRKLLKLSVYKIEEVDMINGYISLLCRVFKGISQLSRGESDFDDKIKDIVEEYNGDDFLRMYEDVCFGNGKRIDFYKYVRRFKWNVLRSNRLQQTQLTTLRRIDICTKRRRFL